MTYPARGAQPQTGVWGGSPQVVPLAKGWSYDPVKDKYSVFCSCYTNVYLTFKDNIYYI